MYTKCFLKRKGGCSPYHLEAIASMGTYTRGAEACVASTLQERHSASSALWDHSKKPTLNTKDIIRQYQLLRLTQAYLVWESDIAVRKSFPLTTRKSNLPGRGGLSTTWWPFKQDCSRSVAASILASLAGN